MKRASALLAAAAILPFSGAAAASEVSIEAEGPVLELQISQQVQAEPDMAMVGAGVTTRARTAVEAMRLNAARMDQVLTRLRQLGIPDARVQTTGINLNAQYNHTANGQSQFIGYDASNNVQIELRDLEQIGQVLDSLVAAGATNLSGPNWSIENDAPLKSQAREAAFRAAQQQAEETARLAGYRGVRLLAVEEQLGYQQPMYDIAPRATTVQASRPTPTRPGRVATSVNLTVKYEMTR